MRTMDAKHFLIRLRLERDKMESFDAAAAARDDFPNA